MSTNASEFERAQRVLVGGVNSAVRAFRAVGGTPRFIARAEGAYMWDVEGKRYIDYLGSWGPMIVGQSHPKVVAAVRDAAARGLSYGAPNVMETELAERLCAIFPQVERVRFTSSGTEATINVTGVRAVSSKTLFCRSRARGTSKSCGRSRRTRSSNSPVPS